ncbi:hypothetical protein AAFC00_001289 [Neodothiora populina]|uniref:60S ribosomal subunit assembly/export protein LOC1 n=1 Tax=Neodothiora populina TaxID=2781224 RepID=A0ABR3PNK0_9PEZI
MAPTKGSSSKGGSSKGGAPSKGGNKKSSSSGGPPKSASSSKVKKSSAPIKTVQQKSKAPKHGPQRKKKRVYTEKELGIPKLNSIVPAGIQKPHGVKKGKTFVDDKESMMTILAMVQAEKEGNIESKMMRARQMEEIRAARKAEMEKKEDFRKQKLEATKDEIRQRKKSNKRGDITAAEPAPESENKPKKKRVSFG